MSNNYIEFQPFKRLEDELINLIFDIYINDFDYIVYYKDGYEVHEILTAQNLITTFKQRIKDFNIKIEIYQKLTVLNIDYKNLFFSSLEKQIKEYNFEVSKQRVLNESIDNLTFILEHNRERVNSRLKEHKQIFIPLFEFFETVINNYKIEVDSIIQNQTEKQKEPNLYPRLFKEKIHFDFFEQLQTTVKKNRELADYSFIFRRMHKDGYIYESIKESEFRTWLNEVYQISLDKLKGLDYCKTDQKETIYSTSKINFKLK